MATKAIAHYKYAGVYVPVLPNGKSITVVDFATIDDTRADGKQVKIAIKKYTGKIGNIKTFSIVYTGWVNSNLINWPEDNDIKNDVL